MKTAEEFWRDLELDPPHPKVLEAEKRDLTRKKPEMIAAVATFDTVMKELSPSAVKIFLAGMYLQGSLAKDAREAFEELWAEIEKRNFERYLQELPQRKGKSNARIARGL